MTTEPSQPLTPQPFFNVFKFRSDSAIDYKPFYLVPILTLPEDSVISDKPIKVIPREVAPGERVVNIAYTDITFGFSHVPDQFTFPLKQDGFVRKADLFKEIYFRGTYPSGTKATYSGNIKNLPPNMKFEIPDTPNTPVQLRDYDMYQPRPFVICIENFRNPDGSKAYWIGALIDMYESDSLSLTQLDPHDKLVLLTCIIGDQSGSKKTCIAPLARITNHEHALYPRYAALNGNGTGLLGVPQPIDYSPDSIITEHHNITSGTGTINR